jgi:glycosyltransferase involved in cell wall biosynthesis
MDVAIFTDNDFEKVNGVTTTLRAVLEYAPAHIRPHVYTCERRGVDRPDYLALKSIGVGIPFYREMKIYAPPFGRFLRRAIADRIDVIHYTTPGPVGLAAMWVAARAGIPMIGSFHTHLAEYARVLSGWSWLGDVMQEYMRCSYGRCRRVLAPSEATCQVLIEAGIEPAKIGIWRRGVNTERFTPARRSAALRERWRVSDSRPALLYAGRLSREKNLDRLVSLQQALVLADVPHQFVFVGDGPMRRQLEASCRSAVFTGTLDRDEVAVAMASADVFVFPSTTDTAGNVVLEAQASGLPVLVTDKGGPHENMIAGVTGVVSSSEDEFIRLGLALARHTAQRKWLGAATRAYALGRRWETSLEPLFRAYVDAAVPSVVPAPMALAASS